MGGQGACCNGKRNLILPRRSGRPGWNRHFWAEVFSTIDWWFSSRVAFSAETTRVLSVSQWSHWFLSSRKCSFIAVVAKLWYYRQIFKWKERKGNRSQKNWLISSAGYKRVQPWRSGGTAWSLGRWCHDSKFRIAWYHMDHMGIMANFGI